MVPFRVTCLTGVLLSFLLTGAGCGPQNGATAPEAHGEQSNTATELRPELAPIMQQIVAGQYAMARLNLQSILARDRDDAQALFLWGLTFHRERRYGQAQPHFEQALELMPEYHPIHHFYGWCMYYLGELETARSAFETHLSMMPNEADSHFALGLIELDEGNLEGAEQQFRRSIELTGDEPRRAAEASKAHARLGETLQRQGDLEGARRHLEIATSLYENHYEAFFMLYRVLMRLGDEEAAAVALRAHDEAKQRVRPEPGRRE